MKNFWKNKNVLITGGAGFIGSHAVRSLLKNKAKVTVIIAPTTKKEKIAKNLFVFRNKIKLIRANLLDRKECLKATRHMDIVLHFAALDGGTIFKRQHPAKLFSTNTLLTLNMLEASAQNHVERFLLMSSIEVYPPESEYPLREETSFNVPDNGYAWSKRLSEVAAKMYFIEYNLPVAVARVGNVYGLHDYANKERGRVIPTFIDKIAKGEAITIVGSGLQEKSFIHVSDVIEGLLVLTEKYAVADPVNIAGKTYITIRGLAQLIAKLMKKKVEFIFEKNKTTTVKKRRISIAKAKKILKFKESITLKQGLEELIAI